MSTRKPNDARLWALMLDPLREAGHEYAEADVLSRQLVALVRRERDPKRATYAPGDQLPDPAPAKVVDVDGIVWEHQDAGNGMYRMSEADRREYADSTFDVQGVRPWPFLLEGEGPLTELDPPTSTTDDVDQVRQAADRFSTATRNATGND